MFELPTCNMSRLTSAQVIALGEYLKPDFEPASLTVPQLLGVFGYHNIRYPSPYTKAKLVQTFNQEIKPNASKFRREKLKKENSQASDDGIVDGVTGLPLTTAKVPLFILSPAFAAHLATTARSTSQIITPRLQVSNRRPLPPSTRPRKTIPPVRCSTLTPRSRQPKRRRSSAQPRLTSHTKVEPPLPQHTIIEESESEQEGPPMRKVGRTKKTVSNVLVSCC